MKDIIEVDGKLLKVEEATGMVCNGCYFDGGKCFENPNIPNCDKKIFKELEVYEEKFIKLKGAINEENNN